MFRRYSGKVKYWLTFNEINSLPNAPFMSGAILTPKSELSEETVYRAMHYQLTASAAAVKLCHEFIPGAMIGCMILGITVYPLTPDPNDNLRAYMRERETYSFADVQVFGKLMNAHIAALPHTAANHFEIIFHRVGQSPAVLQPIAFQRVKFAFPVPRHAAHLLFSSQTGNHPGQPCISW